MYLSKNSTHCFIAQKIVSTIIYDLKLTALKVSESKRAKVVSYLAENRKFMSKIFEENAMRL